MRRPKNDHQARRHSPAHRSVVSTAIAVVSLAAASPGCGGRPFAEGSSRELTIVTHLSADSPEILLLRAVVEREAIRIDSEASYVLRFARPTDSRAYRAANVLVIGHGRLDQIPHPGRKFRERLERGSEPYAFVSDLWLRGQAAGIFWTEVRDDLIPALSRTQNRFFLELDRATFAATRERVLSLPRDGRAERRLSNALGFSLRVPRGYELSIDTEAHAALLLEEGPPTRILRVQVARPGPRGDALLARAALARLFRPDERTLDLADPTLVPDEMAGAVRQLHGRWEDGAVSAAGPFRFYEVARGARRYNVDLAVFAPGRPKLPYLRELQVIAESLAPR